MKRRSWLKGSGLLAAQVGLLGVPSLAAEARPKYRVAVMGATGKGDYGHGLDTAWRGVDLFEVVAVSDANEEGLAKAKERLQVEHAFANFREMMAKAKPDLVSVAPRHIGQHHEMVMAAIEGGAKGIYVEKPFCRDLKEADEIVAACAASGCKVALAHRNRYHPVLPVVKQLLADGELGRVLEIRARGKEDQRGGVLDTWVLGTHVFNLATYFAGGAQACSAGVFQDGREVTKDDLVEGAENVGLIGGNEIRARFETEGGIPIFFDSVREAGSRESGFGIQIVGNQGVIDFRIDESPFAHLMLGHPFDPTPEARQWVPITSAGVGQAEVDGLAGKVANHELALRDLVAAIEEGRDALCSEKEGRQTIEMTLAILESHKQGGRRIGLPLAERGHPWLNW